MPSSPDWSSEYPFASHHLQLDGHRYHYLDEGRGETLLLVHGNPTWSFYYRKLILALRGRYRLVVPDHLGCGLSDKPQDYPYRLADHVSNLGRLIESLDLRDVTLLAHDWGGAIGLGAAVKMPERFSRFVLFNTGAFRSNRIPLRIRACRMPIVGEWAVRGLNAFARAAVRMAVCHHQRMTPVVRAGFLAPYDSWQNRIAVHRFVRDIPLEPSHPSYGALREVEEGLDGLSVCPTMLIWGMRDWCFTPHFLERFLEYFPRAEVHRLADAGHYVIEDAYERIIPLVEEFLAANPLSQSPVRPVAPPMTPQ